MHESINRSTHPTHPNMAANVRYDRSLSQSALCGAMSEFMLSDLVHIPEGLSWSPPSFFTVTIDLLHTLFSLCMACTRISIRAYHVFKSSVYNNHQMFFFFNCTSTMKTSRALQSSLNICVHFARTRYIHVHVHTHRSIHPCFQGSPATFLPTRPRDIHTDLFKGMVLIQFSPYS